jgi:hypothetical protein
MEVFNPSIGAQQSSDADAQANALFEQALPSLVSLLQTPTLSPPASSQQRKNSQDCRNSHNDQLVKNGDESSDTSSTNRKLISSILKIQCTKSSDLC